jgi:hypothetical protein
MMFRRPRPYITNPIPPDVIPPGHVVQDTGASLLLEAEARIKHAARQIETQLWAQSMLFADDRNTELVNVLLELRATLRPSAPGTEVLRETAPARAS